MTTKATINTLFRHFTVPKGQNNVEASLRAELEAGSKYKSETANRTFENEPLGKVSVKQLLSNTLDSIIRMVLTALGLQVDDNEVAAIATINTTVYKKNDGGTTTLGNNINRVPIVKP